jgi:hypothetical protein
VVRPVRAARSGEAASVEVGEIALMFSGAGSLRRGVPIRAFVGGNGSGKSYAAVMDLIPSLLAGRTVLSTCKLYDWRSGELAESFVPLTDWQQIMEAEHCDIFLDEVTGVASSRAYATLPAQLQDKLVQLRRADCTITWTTPNYARADVILREVTRCVTVCRGYLPRRSKESKWPENRFFSWTTYDAQDYEEFVLSKADRCKTLGHQWHHRGKDSHVAKSYRTLDAVSRLTHADLAGSCVGCGLKKKTSYCSCSVPEASGERRRSPRERPAPVLGGESPWWVAELERQNH